MKRLFAGMAAVLMAAISFLPCRAEALSAEKAILVDGITGEVLYEKNADSRSLIASTTKIMTALIICEQCNVLEQVKISKEAVGVEGSSLYLKEGEVLTVQELLYGLMLQSGNDAAAALAIHCSGSIEKFANQMNAKARELELTNTHFVNPHGLDAAEHYSTARDLAVLAAYAMKNPIFRETVSAKHVTIGTRSLTNHNKLLWRLDGAEGVKTGYTKAAGRILVSSAMRNGRRLIAVTINDRKDWDDHVTLMEQGFARYQEKQIVKRGETLGKVSVFGGTGEEVPLAADADFSCMLAENERVTIKMPGPGFCYAPVRKGQRAGNACVILAGKLLGKIPLVYGETVESRKEPSFRQKITGGNR